MARKTYVVRHNIKPASEFKGPPQPRVIVPLANACRVWKPSGQHYGKTVPQWHPMVKAYPSSLLGIEGTYGGCTANRVPGCTLRRRWSWSRPPWVDQDRKTRAAAQASVRHECTRGRYLSTKKSRREKAGWAAGCVILKYAHIMTNGLLLLDDE